MLFRHFWLTAVALLVAQCPAWVMAGEYDGDFLANVSGDISLEYLYFYDSAQYSQQQQDSHSQAANVKADRVWNEGADSLSVHAFLRREDEDSQRNHFDLRELAWVHAEDLWQFSLGISTVYWGVTESQQLVNIVNQVDLVEAIDGQQKLGQAILSATRQTDSGSLSFYVLPGFRERIFPGKEGRMRIPLLIDSKQASYEAAEGARHIDLALRYQGHYRGLDLALSQFVGTSRDPSFKLTSHGTLQPYYPQISQTSVELEFIADDWIWKLEALRRQGQGDSYTAATLGLEYTRYGIFGSAANLSVYLEYLFDQRDDNLYDAIFINQPSDGSATPLFENDFFIGFGFNFNDSSSGSDPDLLFSLFIDDTTGARVFAMAANHKLSSNLKLSIEAKAFSGFDSHNFFYFLEEDRFSKITLSWYF